MNISNPSGSAEPQRNEENGDEMLGALEDLIDKVNLEISDLYEIRKEVLTSFYDTLSANEDWDSLVLQSVKEVNNGSPSLKEIIDKAKKVCEAYQENNQLNNRSEDPDTNLPRVDMSRMLSQIKLRCKAEREKLEELETMIFKKVQKKTTFDIEMAKLVEYNDLWKEKELMAFEYKQNQLKSVIEIAQKLLKEITCFTNPKKEEAAMVNKELLKQLDKVKNISRQLENSNGQDVDVELNVDHNIVKSIKSELDVLENGLESVKPPNAHIVESSSGSLSGFSSMSELNVDHNIVKSIKPELDVVENGLESVKPPNTRIVESSSGSLSGFSSMSEINYDNNADTASKKITSSDDIKRKLNHIEQVTNELVDAITAKLNQKKQKRSEIVSAFEALQDKYRVSFTLCLKHEKKFAEVSRQLKEVKELKEKIFLEPEDSDNICDNNISHDKLQDSFSISSNGTTRVGSSRNQKL